jgi:hypothetical protein
MMGDYFTVILVGDVICFFRMQFIYMQENIQKDSVTSPTPTLFTLLTSLKNKISNREHAVLIQGTSRSHLSLPASQSFIFSTGS